MLAAAAAGSADAAVAATAADSCTPVVGSCWWRWPLPAAFAGAAATGSRTAAAMRNKRPRHEAMWNAGESVQAISGGIVSFETPSVRCPRCSCEEDCRHLPVERVPMTAAGRAASPHWHVTKVKHVIHGQTNARTHLNSTSKFKRSKSAPWRSLFASNGTAAAPPAIPVRDTAAARCAPASAGAATRCHNT